ncbi:MAG: metallophosphoesterase [Candidatus Diapherotrites archaeon]|nr:metallophosphoesterase [Candidatus Diapherotrites archaeon]
MKLNDSFELLGLALYAVKDNTLIISDLHLGFEEAMNSDGVFIPRFNFNEIKERIEEIFSDKKNFNKIIIAGDLKHEFGNISSQEWNEVTEMLSFLEMHSDEVILIKGNHDSILGPIALRKKVKLESEGVFLEKSKAFVMHGDKLIENEFTEKAETLIIGHEHAAVSFSDGLKSEKFKCFLKGKFNEKELIVLPSMCMVFIGTDVKKEKLLSLFLKKNNSEFEIYAVEDKAYFMGKTKLNNH